MISEQSLGAKDKAASLMNHKGTNRDLNEKDFPALKNSGERETPSK